MKEKYLTGSNHPRGTIAIIAIYGALFLVGWAVLYFLVYVPRGPMQP
jgi:hypothetical protein